MSELKEGAKMLKGREKMTLVSFKILPSEYEKLKDLFETLGLTYGAGIRYALTDFLRNKKKELE